MLSDSSENASVTVTVNQEKMMAEKITQLRSFTTLQFSGAKTQEFLQGQLTCDMRDVSSHGAFSLAACCDHRGRMIANFWVINDHDTFLFLLPTSMCDIVKNHLAKYAPFSKVTMAQNDTYFIYSLFLSEPTLHKMDFEQVIRISLFSDERYLLISQKKLFSDSIVDTNEIEFKKNNIQENLCILYPETSLLFTPQMIGLEKLGGVSFEKGCYVGQEIVARTQHLGTLKRHLHQLKIQSDQSVNVGDTLKNSENVDCGVVTESVKITENSYQILAVIQDQMFYNGDVVTPSTTLRKML